MNTASLVKPAELRGELSEMEFATRKFLLTHEDTHLSRTRGFSLLAEITAAHYDVRLAEKIPTLDVLEHACCVVSQARQGLYRLQQL